MRVALELTMGKLNDMDTAQAIHTVAGELQLNDTDRNLLVELVKKKKTEKVK